MKQETPNSFVTSSFIIGTIIEVIFCIATILIIIFGHEAISIAPQAQETL